MGTAAPSRLKVLTTDPPGSPAHLKAHEGRLGSNDLPVLLGIPRFGRTRLRLYGEMRGEIQREDISRRPEIRRGVLLEPVVRQLFSDAIGKPVLPSPGTIQHPTLDCVACTPDGMIGDEPIELKTVGQYARKDWDAGIPLGTETQGQGHAWVCMAVGVWWAAFCLDARSSDEIDVEPDEDEIPVQGDPLLLWAHRDANAALQEDLGNEVVAFMAQVKAGKAPDPAGDFKTVKALWKKHFPGKVAQLSAELEKDWIENQDAAKQRTALKKYQDERKARVLAGMGDAEYGVTAGGIVLRARSNHIRVEAYEYDSRPLIKVKAVGS